MFRWLPYQGMSYSEVTICLALRIHLFTPILRYTLQK